MLSQEPFLELLSRTPDAPMLARVREAVFDPLVAELRAPGDGAPLRMLDAGERMHAVSECWYTH